MDTSVTRDVSPGAPPTSGAPATPCRCCRGLGWTLADQHGPWPCRTTHTGPTHTLADDTYRECPHCAATQPMPAPRTILDRLDSIQRLAAVDPDGWRPGVQQHIRAHLALYEAGHCTLGYALDVITGAGLYP